jgi:hypothetical protein
MMCASQCVWGSACACVNAKGPTQAKPEYVTHASSWRLAACMRTSRWCSLVRDLCKTLCHSCSQACHRDASLMMVH